MFVLQQCLPLAVLKLLSFSDCLTSTLSCNSAYRLRYWNLASNSCAFLLSITVATVLTACGIETWINRCVFCWDIVLQQCLPLAVLKQEGNILAFTTCFELQQCLPLAVLKLCGNFCLLYHAELQQCLPLAVLKLTTKQYSFKSTCKRCNSAYRLRYWNWR